MSQDIGNVLILKVSLGTGIGPGCKFGEDFADGGSEDDTATKTKRNSSSRPLDDQDLSPGTLVS